MSDELRSLIEKARRIQMTPEELEAQRISFAYGNAHYENSRITRDLIIRSSLSLKTGTGSSQETHS